MSAWGVAALAGIQVRQHWTLVLGTWQPEREVSFLKVECWSLWILRVEYGKDVRRWRPWDQKAKNSWEKKEGVRLWRRSTRGGDQQRSERCQTLNHEDDLKIFLQGRVDGLLDDKYRALSSKEQGAAETHSCHFQLDRHIFFSHRHQQRQIFIHRSDIKKFLSRWNEACQRMLRWNPVGTEWSIGLLRRKPPMNFKYYWLLYFLLLSVFSIAFINTSRLEAQVLKIVSMHSSTDVCKALKALLWTSYDHSLASFMFDTYSRVPSVCQPTKPPWPKIQLC